MLATVGLAIDSLLNTRSLPTKLTIEQANLFLVNVFNEVGPN